jgi:hypothetical protein
MDIEELLQQTREAKMAEQDRPQERTTRPTGGPAGPGAKGATVNPNMGPPGSPSGPNETDGDPSGVIQPQAITPPGEDQPHLLGGDVGTPQTSQTGNPNWTDEPQTASPKASKK